MFDRVAAWIEARHECSRDRADRALDQALALLHAHAATLDSQRPLMPSWPVRQAWEAFVLHTTEYAEFCQQNFDEFLHYTPVPDGHTSPADRAVRHELRRSMILIREQRFVCDVGMWDRAAP